MKTPVAFMIFNRPEAAAQVFEAIRKAKPETLLVVADGPRENVLDDASRCRDTRRIIDQVDWPCEVIKRYSDVNLGCKRNVSSGLDWVFNTVEEAVILEDDCLPTLSFFRFCEELLDRFRFEDGVMHVAGTNFVANASERSDSYYFSRFANIWGWATWRRAWCRYDVDLSAWKNALGNSKRLFLARFDDARERGYWENALQATASGEIDTWDYQWMFACMGGLAIVPKHNLISNIGFGDQATHTKKWSRVAALRTKEMDFPLVHPSRFEQNPNADRLTAKANYRLPSNCRMMMSAFKRMLKRSGVPARQKLVRTTSMSKEDSLV